MQRLDSSTVTALAYSTTMTSGRQRRHSRSYRLRRLLGTSLVYLLLVFFAVMLGFPLFWAISTSVKPLGQVAAVPPVWWPAHPLWGNFVEAWNRVPFLIFTRNTAFITITTLAGNVLASSLTAFSFSRLRYPGRNVMFGLVIATMLIPGFVTLVPTFILFHRLHWVGTFLPLIVPAFFGGSSFYVFLLRQFFLTLPLELDEAARIDGASYPLIYAKIIVPLAKPALTAVALFEFIGHWNDYLGPLIYLNSMDHYTLAIGLAFFQGRFYTYQNLMMAASLIVLAPCIIVFLLGQKYFIQGITFTGGK